MSIMVISYYSGSDISDIWQQFSTYEDTGQLKNENRKYLFTGATDEGVYTVSIWTNRKALDNRVETMADMVGEDEEHSSVVVMPLLFAITPMGDVEIPSFYPEASHPPEETVVERKQDIILAVTRARTQYENLRQGGLVADTSTTWEQLDQNEKYVWIESILDAMEQDSSPLLNEGEA